jgi:hypothetical protein
MGEEFARVNFLTSGWSQRDAVRTHLRREWLRLLQPSLARASSRASDLARIMHPELFPRAIPRKAWQQLEADNSRR